MNKKVPAHPWKLSPINLGNLCGESKDVRKAIEIEKARTINKQNLPTVWKILLNKQQKAQDINIPIHTEQTNSTVSSHHDHISYTPKILYNH